MEVGGCPSLLRTDCGTENVVIAGTQCFLRADCDDELAGENSHRYGPSTGNQRIEAWWAQLRRSRLTWWINFFKDLVDRGIFLTGDVLHGECIWFCFAELIQHDLDFGSFTGIHTTFGIQGMKQFLGNQRNSIIFQKTLELQTTYTLCSLKS